MDISFVSGVMSGSLAKLLSPSHLKSFEDLSRKDFLSLLKTHQFGKANETNIDQIMLEEEHKHKIFLESLIDKDALIFKVLYVSFDHLFLSNLMKSYHLGLPYHRLIKDLSNFDEEQYENYCIHSVFGLLDLEDVEFLDQLILETKNLDAQAISDKVIKILHDNIYLKINKKTDTNLIKYLDLETTILNVMLLIRSKKYDKDISYLESNILKGGMIDRHILLGLYHKTLNELGSYLNLHFDLRLQEAFKHIESEKFLDILNDAFNVYLKDLLEDLSFESMGFAPVIHYTLLKRSEMRLLKSMYYQIKE